MKIKRFKTINEQNKEYELFVFLFIDNVHDNYPDILIYDNFENAFNYLKNRMYNLFKNNENILKKLDTINSIDELIEFYEQNESRYFYYFKDDIQKENVELDNWIKIRLDTNKYNI